MSGGLHLDGFTLVRGADRGAPEVLREVVDLDDLLAQDFLAAPLGVFIGRDDVVLFCSQSYVASRARRDLALLQRLAQLLVDRLAGDRREERGFEGAGRIRFRFWNKHPCGQSVAGSAGLERDARRILVARVERRAE